MYADGIWLKDHDGRTRMLRGANLGGSSKVPAMPDGATYCGDGFFDHRSVSFVGRPFPLIEADEHLSRLKSWGLTFLRFLVTWEAIEHAGPGEYDEAYLDYVRAVIQKAGEHGIELFIDPHQDVWSRWTGGDGAPGWTLEAVGMDLTKLYRTGAALSHQEHGDPLPQMTWFSNYSKFGAATMFALFFGGNDFAPKTQIDGVPVQEYLQSHYIESIKRVAERVHDLPNVVGYDSLNEPVARWIGYPDLAALQENDFARVGVTLTPFEAMQTAAGHSLTAPVYELGGLQAVEQVTVNPDHLSVWRDGYADVWQQNGVWTNEGGEARLLRPQHFSDVNGRTPSFEHDYLKPFIARFAQAIRTVHPRALVFIEAEPGGESLTWTKADPPQIVNAGHWYDGITLMNKHFEPDRTIDVASGQFVVGEEAVAQSFVNAVGAVKAQSVEQLGGVPTLIGEFGLPFDLDHKQAYLDGDFSMHVRALDLYFSAMDAHLLNCTIWNYTADNNNERGDMWNDEDLSIYSRDQRANPDDINSGGRALEAIVRPYAQRVAGEPLRMKFDLATQTFEFEFRHDPAITAPTEIFVPEYQYDGSAAVEVSDGMYSYDREAQLLTYTHTTGQKTHTIRITRE